jgi:hypothetical protein
MKTLAKLAALAIILFMVACTKESKFLVNTSLQGKWKLSAIYSDPGDGSGTYHSVATTGEHSITLKSDGTLEVTGLNNADNFLQYFSQYKSYTQRDSTTLVFKTQAGITTQTFIYKIEGDKLTLMPAGPVMCIEGCGTRFEKVK